MPKDNQDQVLNFRANAALAGAAAEAAAAEGLTLSAFARRAMEREVEATRHPNGDLTHPDMIALGARGNHAAQSQLAAFYLGQAMAGDELSPDAGSALAANAMLQRYSLTLADKRNLEATTELTGYALAIVEACAEAGHVPSSFFAVEIAQRMTPEAIAWAKARKGQIKVNPLTPEETNAGFDLAAAARIIAAMEGAH
jgi:predicted HicB family RNase H-like nuclease